MIVLEGLSEAKKRALLLADNKIAENAGWDRKRLAVELPELAELLIEEGSTFRLLASSRSKSTKSPSISRRTPRIPQIASKATGWLPRW